MDDTLEQQQPWERQPGEPNRWYARFERYRLAGPSRSLLGIVNTERQERGGKRGSSVPQAWAKNAKAWQWRVRAEAWDEHQRGVERAAYAAQVEEMNRRHAQEAKALQSLAIQRLKSLTVDHLSTADTLRFLTEAAKLERSATGQPETITEQRLTGKNGGAVVFTIEDAVNAAQELEEWENDRLHTRGGQALPHGNTEVP
jgi:hypothetical protein